MEQLSEEKLDPALKSILRDKVISGKALEELAAKYEERFWLPWSQEMIEK